MTDQGFLLVGFIWLIMTIVWMLAGNNDMALKCGGVSLLAFASGGAFRLIQTYLTTRRR